MRINQYVAKATGVSRRTADSYVQTGRVQVNNKRIPMSYQVVPDDTVTLDDKLLNLKPTITVALHKPVGYVCSRAGQGSKTVYSLLPDKYRHLKPVGRLDKDSSGLLIMTNDGKLAQELTHPSSKKLKTYFITLNKPLNNADKAAIIRGVKLEDGVSKLQLRGSGLHWEVRMREGRNRQIRRTFQELNYTVNRLHRTQIGPYNINSLQSGKYVTI